MSVSESAMSRKYEQLVSWVEEIEAQGAHGLPQPAGSEHRYGEQAEVLGERPIDRDRFSFRPDIYPAA